MLKNRRATSAYNRLLCPYPTICRNGLNSMPLMSLSNLLPEMQKPKTNPNVFVPSQNCTEEKKDMSPFNAQEILSGLPGIEITKVDKKAVKSETDINKSCQTAQVSIIPASNGGEKFPLDKDDWLYGKQITQTLYILKRIAL